MLDPLKQLVFVAADERFVPGELAGRIKTLNALLEDLGKGMSREMQQKWADRVSEVSSDCEENKYGLAAEIQKLCVATLRTEQARFYEVVEEDYLGAAGCYEEAASIMEEGQLLNIANELVKSLPENTKVLLESTSLPELEEASRHINAMLSFIMCYPAVDLWDAAGDAYCRVEKTGEKAREARRCYEHALQILKLSEESEPGDDKRETRLCHIWLSLANILLAHFEEWNEAEALYKEAADALFFNRKEKGAKEYHDICGIIVDSDILVSIKFKEPDCAPHVWVSAAAQYKESLARLKADIGERALDVLREDFEKSEEGFPVPETHYLVAALGELYEELKEYDKCVNVVGKRASFDDAFIEWSLDELLGDPDDWVFPFLLYKQSSGFARGLLQRPDYKELVEQQKKAEESHQRQEWKQIRVERMLEKQRSLPTIEETQAKLVKQNPWLGSATNLGSVVNAEVLYQQLITRNWGEVVVSLLNAVEEELKQFLYKKYLAFRSERFEEGYGEESRRQKEQGSVLHFIASMTKNDASCQIWKQFIATNLPRHMEFLSKELPALLKELVGLRGPSAHGSMPDRQKAVKAREVVMGKPGRPGLLERLVALSQSSSSGQA